LLQIDRVNGGHEIDSGNRAAQTYDDAQPGVYFSSAGHQACYEHNRSTGMPLARLRTNTRSRKLGESNAALPTRRHFVQQMAVAAAAFCGSPINVLAGTQRKSEARGQHTPPVDEVAIRKLASKISGHVITPEAPDYESARLVFNRAFDRRPALIVRCAGASDVARALAFAQKQNLPLAVRGGGHNRAGFSVCDRGVVIDLSGMNRVEVDAGKRVARAEAGALVRDLDQATQRFGLATTSGGCPTVGIAGLTLGGGEGLLMSKYGVACDNLIWARLVTVDGRQVEASRNSNSDLFWAIRGGGGNFGVATALEYRLHPVADVLTGTLVYPVGRIPELLQAFVKFVAAAPDEMNVVGMVLPSEQGTRFQMLVCHCGHPRQGNELLKPLRALKPREDNVRVKSYLEAQAAAFLPAPVAHFQTDLFLPELSAAAIATITEATNDARPSTRVFIVPLYGAVTRVGLSDTAFPLRRPGYEVDLVGVWSAQAEKESAVQWVKSLRDNLRPFAHGVYVNQLGETSEELVKAAYGTNYARLVEIKKKYDPRNVLRLNQNIKADEALE
jgi:FAD/FMN-containing dehydrogenase